MSELVEVAVAQLELDPKNPRLPREQTTQLETAHALALQQGPRLVALARHIVNHGIDPTTLTAIVALPGRGPRYKVVEGNRRTLALKALESPSLVTPALDPRDARSMSRLSVEFAENPIERITCFRFDSEDEARVWYELRHTPSDGAGLVAWTAEEKRRYEARTGPGSVELQVVDFVKAVGGLDADATGAFITNVNRALLSAKLMARYGLEKEKGTGRVLSWFPAAEIRKPLTKLVNDMHSGRINSRALNGPDDRERYADSFAARELPKASTRLSEPVPLDELGAGYKPGTGGSPKPKPKPKPSPRVRTTLIPRDCSLNPTSSRLVDIVRELKSLNVNDYPNACSVMLRVFLELSMDAAIDELKLKATVTESDPLAKKIRAVAAELRKNDQISVQLKRAIDGVANSRTNALAAGIFTWHQYVHNQYVHPKATELRQTWDEIQPFVQALWP